MQTHGLRTRCRTASTRYSSTQVFTQKGRPRTKSLLAVRKAYIDSKICVTSRLPKHRPLLSTFKPTRLDSRLRQSQQQEYSLKQPSSAESEYGYWLNVGPNNNLSSELQTPPLKKEPWQQVAETPSGTGGATAAAGLPGGGRPEVVLRAVLALVCHGMDALVPLGRAQSGNFGEAACGNQVLEGLLDQDMLGFRLNKAIGRLVRCLAWEKDGWGREVWPRMQIPKSV